MDERRSSGLHPLELERWLLDQASADENRRVEASLAPAERARLREDDAALRRWLGEAQPAAAFAARVRAKAVASASEAAPRDAAARVRMPAAWLAAGSGLLVAAVMMVVVLRPDTAHELPRADNEPDGARSTAPAQTGATERSKGLHFELRVYRQRGGLVERLAQGAEAAPREVLQLGYVRDGYAHGVLLSLDGRGAVTLHLPRAAADSTALPHGSGEQLLPEAYELDDAPGFERFIFVGSAEPLPVAAVLEAARDLANDPARAQKAPLDLAVHSGQRSVLIRKSAPP